MMFYIRFFLPLALWALLTAAAPGRPASVHLQRSSNQSFILPTNVINPDSKCTAACSPLQQSLAAMTNISDPATVCTDTIAAQYDSCLTCEEPEQTISETERQSALNEFQTACAYADHSIKIPSGAARLVCGAQSIMGIAFAAALAAVML